MPACLAPIQTLASSQDHKVRWGLVGWAAREPVGIHRCCRFFVSSVPSDIVQMLFVNNTLSLSLVSSMVFWTVSSKVSSMVFWTALVSLVF